MPTSPENAPVTLTPEEFDAVRSMLCECSSDYNAPNFTDRHRAGPRIKQTISILDAAEARAKKGKVTEDETDLRIQVLEELLSEAHVILESGESCNEPVVDRIDKYFLANEIGVLLKPKAPAPPAAPSDAELVAFGLAQSTVLLNRIADGEKLEDIEAQHSPYISYDSRGFWWFVEKNATGKWWLGSDPRGPSLNTPDGDSARAALAKAREGQR